MEVEYKAYKERRSYRIKIIIIYIVCWIPYFLLVSWIYFYVNWLFGLLVGIGFIGFIGTAMYVEYHFWISEPNETMIFVNLYKALGLLELYSEEKESSKMLLRKATKHVKEAIKKMYPLWHPEKMNSILFDKEFREPLENLSKNLKNRILPRIIQGKEIHKMQSTLRGLVKVFGEIVRPISLNQIVSLNENLESFEEVSIREKTIKSAIKTAMISKPMKLLFSIFLGYFSIVAITFFFCQSLQMDFVNFLRNNLTVVISSGAVISGIIVTVLVFKR